MVAGPDPPPERAEDLRPKSYRTDGRNTGAIRGIFKRRPTVIEQHISLPNTINNTLSSQPKGDYPKHNSNGTTGQRKGPDTK